MIFVDRIAAPPKELTSFSEKVVKQLSEIYKPNAPFRTQRQPDFNLPPKGYRLFFWVLAQQYGTGARIQSSELARFRSFGKVEVFAESAETNIRAKIFKAYVTAVGGI